MSRPPWPPSAPGRCSRPGAARRRSPAVAWRWICSWPGSACSPMTPPSPPPCAPGAVAALRSGPAAEAFQLGQDAISLLDRHHQPVPLSLLRQTADAALTSGDGQAGEALLDRAVQQAESGDEQEPARSTRPGSSPNKPAT